MVPKPTAPAESDVVSAYAVPDVTVPPVMAMPVEVTVPVVWVWFGMAMAKPFQLSVPAPVFWTMALPVTERPLYVYVDAPVLVTAGRVTAAPVTDSPVAVTLVERFRFRPVSVPARVTAEGAAPWMMVPEVVVDSTSRRAPGPWCRSRRRRPRATWSARTPCRTSPCRR